jgi:Ca-activated chloride channel family protein
MLHSLKDIEWANAEYLWLLLLLPILAAYLVWRRKKMQGEVSFSNVKLIQGNKKQILPHLRFVLPFLKIMALALFIIAFARPQSSLSWQNVTTEGIDIVVSLDISGSMLAKDFKPNRLEASKDLAIEFISGRPNDRIGLVVFSGESFTQCPLTTDHDILKNLFKDIQNGMIEDGTAIGMGLATAINRLKDSNGKSKVVILLTDGVNTGGAIPPLTAAEIAKEFGIRVYTIGVGKKGMAPMPYRTPFGGIAYQNVEVRIDEPTLNKIAELTDGKYFRATDNSKLREVYKEIDKLEKSKIAVTEYRKKTELFFLPALIGLILMLSEFILKQFLFKSIVA